MQNKKNTTFKALLRLFYALELAKKWFKASFETYIQGGANCQKLKSQNENFENAKNKQSNLIANVNRQT